MTLREDKAVSVESATRAATAGDVLHLRVRLDTPGVETVVETWYWTDGNVVKTQLWNDGTLVRSEVIAGRTLSTFTPHDGRLQQRPLDRTIDSPQSVALRYLGPWEADSTARVRSKGELVEIVAESVLTKRGAEQPPGTVVRSSLLLDSSTLLPVSLQTSWDRPDCCDFSEHSDFETAEFIRREPLGPSFFDPKALTTP
jgi:hypothetical protein